MYRLALTIILACVLCSAASVLAAGPGLAASSAPAKYCNPQVQYGEGDGVFGNRVDVSCALATRITKILEHRRTNLPDGFRCNVMKNVNVAGGAVRCLSGKRSFTVGFE